MKKKRTVFSVIQQFEGKIPEIQCTNMGGATATFVTPFNVRYVILREYVKSYEYDAEKNILYIFHTPYSEDIDK